MTRRTARAVRRAAGGTIVAAVLAVLAGCGSDGGEPAGATVPATASAPGGGTIVWIAQGGGIDRATLRVPVDYDDPDGASMELALVRHRATEPDERIGTLLVNPGGPGFGGTTLAESAESTFGDDLLERFDIVGWDPRGTGDSSPAIDCFDDADRVFMSNDITPDDQAERDALVDTAREVAEGCVERNGAVLQHLGTNDSARDMDAIRQALGEATISYFGFSYGSELGATWATLFPDTVRAAVLDGAVDPNADALDRGLQQNIGFEAQIDRFLAECSSDDDCAFHNDGDAEGAFDRLMAAIDETPLPTTDSRPPLTRGAAMIGVGLGMYDRDFWPPLAKALASAQDGDGAPLLLFYDAYIQRDPATGEVADTLEAFQVISCMDSADRPSVAEEDAEAAQFRAVAPRFSPNTTGSYFCTFFPPSESPRVEITGAGAGPIVVIGTTGDPATPLDGTQRMADALDDGRLVVVTADRHTGYGVNRCSLSTVDEYLLDPAKAPADGTRCD